MNRIELGVLLCFMMFTLVACASGSTAGKLPDADAGTNQLSTVQTDGNTTLTVQTSGGIPEKFKVLIAYFSRVGNTDFPKGIDAIASASLMKRDGELVGNTQYIAQLIEQSTEGDLFLIQTEEKYPADYDETDAQGNRENRARTRPALASHVERMEDYDIVFLGFPNWYYDMPMAVYSFLEEYDLSGKIIVPFSTSGAAGFSDTVSTIQDLEPKAHVLTDGFTVRHSKVEDITAEDIDAWLSGLNLR